MIRLLIGALLGALLFLFGLATNAFAAERGKGLHQYTCAWVNEQRKTYTDDELIKRARKWHIPEDLIERAKACPR